MLTACCIQFTYRMSADQRKQQNVANDKTTEQKKRRMSEKKIFLNIKHGEKSDQNNTEYFREEKLMCLLFGMFLCNCEYEYCV